MRRETVCSTNTITVTHICVNMHAYLAIWASIFNLKKIIIIPVHQHLPVFMIINRPIADFSSLVLRNNHLYSLESCNKNCHRCAIANVSSLLYLFKMHHRNTNVFHCRLKTFFCENLRGGEKKPKTIDVNHQQSVQGGVHIYSSVMLLSIIRAFRHSVLRMVKDSLRIAFTVYVVVWMLKEPGGCFSRTLAE